MRWFMFGMSDPNQTLSQMIRYFEEERHEMVEVMASEFTSMLLANKQRDGAMQTFSSKGSDSCRSAFDTRKGQIGNSSNICPSSRTQEIGKDFVANRTFSSFKTHTH